MVGTFLFFAACTGLEPLAPLPTDTASNDGGVALGDLVLDPGSIDFGDVEVGTGAAADVIARNDGEVAISLTEVTVTGDSAFALAGTVATPLGVEAGSEAVFSIWFVPSVGGAAGGTLAVSTDAMDGTAEVALSGTGTVGGGGDDTGDEPTGEGLDYSASSIAFGTVSIGIVATEDVVIDNVGATDVLIVDIVSSDSTVTTSGLTPPQTIAAGQSKTLTIAYAPTAEVATNATVYVTANPAEYGENIAVSGTGYQGCSVCAPMIDVDTGDDPHAIEDFVSAFGASDTRSVNVQNIGDEDLDVTDITLNNDTIADCGSFTLEWDGATTLAPWSTTVFSVTYTATSTCLDLANESFDENVVHVISTDPSEPDWVISLGGVGLVF